MFVSLKIYILSKSSSNSSLLTFRKSICEYVWLDISWPKFEIFLTNSGISNVEKILNKKNRAKIVCLTAYSKNVAEEVDKYVDIVLVGDSLGSVLYNYDSTRSVTLDEMISHSKSVRKGIKKSLLCF